MPGPGVPPGLTLGPSARLFRRPARWCHRRSARPSPWPLGPTPSPPLACSPAGTANSAAFDALLQTGPDSYDGGTQRFNGAPAGPLREFQRQKSRSGAPRMVGVRASNSSGPPSAVPCQRVRHGSLSAVPSGSCGRVAADGGVSALTRSGLTMERPDYVLAGRLVRCLHRLVERN